MPTPARSNRPNPASATDDGSGVALVDPVIVNSPEFGLPGTVK
jgi:hypothetical protein